MEAPSLGWHEGIAMRDYLRIEAASSSRMEVMRRVAVEGMAPAKARSIFDNRREPTKAQKFGSVIHTAILEPFNFHAEYTVAEQCCGEIKSGQRKGMRCANTGTLLLADESGWVCGVHAKGYDEGQLVESKLTTITQEEKDTALAIRDSVFANPRAKAILGCETSQTEVSGLFEDPVTGVLGKVRPDHRALFPNYGNVRLQLKSAESASDRDFQKAILKYGYHRREAFYNLAEAAIDGGPPRDSVFLIVEKDPPYLTALRRIDEGALDAGERQMRVALHFYAKHTKAGQWPGYGTEVKDVTLPHHEWANVEFETEQFKDILSAADRAEAA